MKKRVTMLKTLAAILLVAAAVNLCSCNTNSSNATQSEIDSLRNEIKQLTTNDAAIAKNLQTFDTLDYTVFSNQEWTRLHESHAQDIKVYWPDGHVTTGIEKHIEDLKAMFVYAP